MEHGEKHSARASPRSWRWKSDAPLAVVAFVGVVLKRCAVFLPGALLILLLMRIETVAVLIGIGSGMAAITIATALEWIVLARRELRQVEPESMPPGADGTNPL